MRNKRRTGVLALALGIVATVIPAGAAEQESKALKLVDKVQFTGGTELAASGDHVYAGELNGETNRNQDLEKGGVHIFDVSGKTPREVGFFHCPGNDNDVEVVKPGLIAMGHHTAACNQPKDGEATAGLVLIDVSNPSSPRMVGSLNLPSGMQAHTIRPYPGTDYIYVNPGGLPSNGRMQTHIVDVSNPKKPKIAGTYFPAGSSTGCHDFSFHISNKNKLGFCAGLGGFGIWDVSDPLKPTVISTIRNPLIQFNHYAVPSSDGKLWPSTTRLSRCTPARGRPARQDGPGSTTSRIRHRRSSRAASRLPGAATRPAWARTQAGPLRGASVTASTGSRVRTTWRSRGSRVA